MKKSIKKLNKKKHRNGFRNASPKRITRRIPSVGADSASSGGPPKKKSLDDAGARTLKTLGGAGITAAACAFVAREKWLPPTWLTAIVGGVGALAGVIGKTDTIRSIGNGAMSAAGAQLGLLVIDKHHEEVAKQEVAAAQPAPKKRDVESLPPGALEAAYERARRRLALSEAASKMAA